MKDSDKYIGETEKALSGRKANFVLPGVGREIVIHIPNDLTDAEFDVLLKWLELQKFGFVSPTVSKDKNNGKQEE